MSILDLNGDPLDCQILVFGPDSHEAAKIANETEKAAWKQLAAAAGKKGGKQDGEDGESVDKLVDKAIRMTKGWKNIQWAGKEFEFNDTNARQLYTKGPYIRDQVLRFYQDRSNFMPSGLKN
jgi:hypothetical protein